MPDRTTVTVTAPTTGPGPWRYASVTLSCQRCGAALRSGRSRRFCGSACRQAAYRDRLAASRPTAAPLPALPRQGHEAAPRTVARPLKETGHSPAGQHQDD